jgi:hypothetical protein
MDQRASCRGPVAGATSKLRQGRHGATAISTLEDRMKAFPAYRESVHRNTLHVSLNPKELQDVLDELEASRASRKRP